uniref:Uncharacterized protein n=1 Tax=Rhizophora mucronata TaxID=61149 RepID=A0A2P2PTH6_RHIMU
MFEKSNFPFSICVTLQ